MPIPWMRPDGLLRLDWHRSSAAHPKFWKRSQLVETVSKKRKNVGPPITVYGRRVNSFVLVCSLSSHRHSYIPLIFGSRFIDS
jgi:hypothetical protein